MPRNLQTDWYRTIYKERIEIHEKFPELLDFLKIERSSLEYGMSELRLNYERKQVYLTSGGQVNDQITGCLIHNNESHKTCECYTYLAMRLSEKYDRVLLLPNAKS